ncbi:MAG TPA: hypothetical protein VGE45_16850 [Chloroflexia bacterium]|jgi:hypothetical protein
MKGFTVDDSDGDTPTMDEMRTKKVRRKKANPAPPPAFRRLRGYAFDPSLSLELDTALVNEVVFKVTWEGADKLGVGPVGEYVEVVDYDPGTKYFYEPVDLNDPLVLAQDGLSPSESNPQFHQQMVYAVVMTTIDNFERALGRKALWASHKVRSREDPDKIEERQYVPRLRVYPHAMPDLNAYYSPDKVALLFGYALSSMDARGHVYTCLSHDIIAHETTHALLDGMYDNYADQLSQPDVGAFHEAFADIVALFQHFSFPEVLRHEVARIRGNLHLENLLSKLAAQLGAAIGLDGALRDALGEIDRETKKWVALKPDPTQYQNVLEPHARGAILVATIFDAFVSIYDRRVADLIRIATGGSGILPEGALHPDLVNRLSKEAATAAQHVLHACVRALDYCPPVDIDFGDYLRAIITADVDIVPDDERGYRVAFIEAFRRRGIYPQHAHGLSVDGLIWPKVSPQANALFRPIAKKLRDFPDRAKYFATREEAFEETQHMKERLEEMLKEHVANPECAKHFEKITGLVFSPDSNIFGNDEQPDFEVNSLQPARRVGPDGRFLNQLVITLTQSTEHPLIKTKGGDGEGFVFKGGCTLILDLDKLELTYSIVKSIRDKARWKAYRDYRSYDPSLRATYFGALPHHGVEEPFAILHRGY